jgi:hypothetical protein
MKKGLKIFSTSLLLSTLVFAGCSCSKSDKTNVSRIEDSRAKFLSGLSDEASDYTLLDIYNAMIDGDAGNAIVANKLIEFVANEVLELDNSESVWKERYEKLVKEQLEELASSDDYLVKNKFSESYMIESLKAEGYTVTCDTGVTYGTPSELACDYSDYVNKNIKVDVLSTLLKEKYIQDVTMKDKTNILTTKKIRDVEYISISSSLDSSYDDLDVREFMREIRDKIASGEVVDFSEIENDFKKKLTEIVTTEYNKIGTVDDYSQSIASSYTNSYTQDKEVGYQSKIDEINEGEYSFSTLISSDSDSSAIVSEDITSSLLAITDPTDESFARKVISVTDTAGNTYYYLVSVNAGTTIDASDVLLTETSDSSTYTYSIVRFRVINADTTDEDDIYKAVQLLASNSTLASNALSYYIEDKKDAITVYDDDVKTYLSNLYPDLFTD